MMGSNYSSLHRAVALPTGVDLGIWCPESLGNPGNFYSAVVTTANVGQNYSSGSCKYFYMFVCLFLNSYKW